MLRARWRAMAIRGGPAVRSCYATVTVFRARRSVGPRSAAPPGRASHATRASAAPRAASASGCRGRRDRVDRLSALLDPVPPRGGPDRPFPRRGGGSVHSVSSSGGTRGRRAVDTTPASSRRIQPKRNARHVPLVFGAPDRRSVPEQRRPDGLRGRCRVKACVRAGAAAPRPAPRPRAEAPRALS